MEMKLRMTKEGIEEQYKRLEELVLEAKELDKAMTLSCKNSSGDGPHDNAEFEELLRQANMKAREIKDLKLQIMNTEVIDLVEMDLDCVNIGDILDVNFVFSPDDEEEMTIELIGGTGKCLNNQVSINSPVGRAIYGKKIGETVLYSVNNNEVRVDLLRKVKTKGRSK